MISYDSVGLVIHCIPRNLNVYPMKVITVTVLQMITSSLIRLVLDDTIKKYLCQMVFTNALPTYVDNNARNNIFLVEKIPIIHNYHLLVAIFFI